MQRLFFALWPSPQAARALHRWAQRAQPVCGGRVTRESTIHLTLAFLGAVDGERIPALVQCARGVRGCGVQLRLDVARRWKHNGIVWAGPRKLPDSLADLAGQLERALAEGGFRTEQRAFKAHVTLLRRTEHAAPLPPFEAVEWQAEQFALVRSALAADGPAYATLERFPLAVTRAQ